MSPADVPRDADLPDRLADLAAERIASAGAAARDDVVRTLIDAHPRYAQALRALAADLAGAERLLEAASPVVPDMPTAVGPYRVLRRLGEGAFGTVFLCLQERPVRREVAVKVLRPGAGDRSTLLRFEDERQLIASLDHPCITRVLDAGTLEDGRPYFVMDHVDGPTITAYCDARSLSVPRRLALFVELCRGVQHAHARGIVHRDLKPANVLVVEHDGRPVPKIIDFGIAKVLACSWTASREATEIGRVVGSPGYMSPEQAKGQPGEVDARSDVFALGVMLYELLAGDLPWRRDDATRDRDPPRPSTRATTDPARSAAIAGKRATQPRRLASALRGDLDWIALKALQQERADRYPSAQELADDVARHLRNEPVSAGPPSSAYRLRKLARRHRAGVRAALAAGAIAALAFGLAWAYGKTVDVEAANARAEAERAAADAGEAVQKLLERATDERLLSAPKSDGLRQALLEDALALYERFLGTRPSDPASREGRCRALIMLSQVHWLLGEPGRAEAAAEEARVEAEALLAAEPAHLGRRLLVADAHRRKGRALVVAGQQARAQAELARAVEGFEACHARSPGEHGRELSAVLRELATTQSSLGEGTEAVASARRSVAILEETIRRRPDVEVLRNDLLFARVGLAHFLIGADEPTEAELILQGVEAELPRATADRTQLTARLYGLLAKLARRRGDGEGAVHRLRDAAQAGEQWIAEQPQRLLPRQIFCTLLFELGAAYEAAADWELASPSYRRALEVREGIARDFPDDPQAVISHAAGLYDYARVLWDRFRRQDLAEAEACTRRALELHEKAQAAADGPVSRTRWGALALRAQILDARGGHETRADWEAVAAALPDDARDPGALFEAWLGVARSRLHAGATSEATDAAARARALLAAPGAAIPHGGIELGVLEARLAAGAGDHAAAAAAADFVLAARPTWLGRYRAAACLYAAWRCALEAPGGDADAACRYRDRAAELDRAVVDALASAVAGDPADPWHVVPWGFSSLRLALVEQDRGNRAAASELLDAARPALEAVRDAAHADRWEEELMRAAAPLREAR